MRPLPTGTITLFFSDIEGSTLTLSRLGERWGEALTAQRAIMRAVFEQYDGYEMGTEGDSFFVVFTSARQAVLAAVEGQRRLQSHDWPDGVPIRVRIGLHTGEPTRHEDGYIGIDVHRAARVAGTASGGQIVLSEATRLLAAPLDDRATVRDLGWHRLKDLSEPERLFDLVVPGLLSEFPPVRSIGTRASLPGAPTPLVGREGELAELQSVIRDPNVRLLTLTGPGGSGKTRLAVAVASALEHHFPMGIFFAALHTADRAATMWLGIADALGVAGEAEELPRDRIRRFLADRSILLILDNLEQVPDADQVVSDLLGAAPRLSVLATSRRPLHLVSEYEHPVPPLELPERSAMTPEDAARSGAVQLFVKRARMVRPGFDLTAQNVADVVELSRRLDGLPLAIELAAARSKLLTPRALLARLDHLGAEVAPADRTERQRTLSATISWSYELLTDPEKGVFRRLGVFAGHCDLEAIEAVVETPGVDPLDTVAHLVDMSLVQIVDGSDGEPRVRMLETIRAFARHQLEAAMEGDEVRLRHARWHAEKAADVNRLLGGPTHIEALDQMAVVDDDIRAALDWCLVPITGDVGTERTNCGLRLVSEMATYWYRFGYAAEGRGWFGRVLALATGVQSPEIADALHGVAVLQLQLGDTGPAIAGLQRALEMARGLGDRDQEARELNSLGVAYRDSGELNEARRLIDQSIQISRDIGSKNREGTALANLVILLMDAGQWRDALVAARDTVAASQQLGDAWAVACDECNLTMALLHVEGAEAAYTHLSTVAPRALALEDIELNIGIVEIFASIFADLGQIQLSAQLVTVADRQRSVVGMPRSDPDQRFVEESLDKAGARSDPRWAVGCHEGEGVGIHEAVTRALSFRVPSAAATPSD